MQGYEQSLFIYHICNYFSYYYDITVTEFRDAVFQISQINPAFTRKIEQMNWQELRTMVRSMHKKYKNEESHEGYNSYINLTRQHFRNLLTF